MHANLEAKPNGFLYCCIDFDGTCVMLHLLSDEVSNCIKFGDGGGRCGSSFSSIFFSCLLQEIFGGLGLVLINYLVSFIAVAILFATT